ncbi:hypothetical protein AB0881_37570, partial [Spirillospora sp. NPDC029432]
APGGGTAGPAAGDAQPPSESALRLERERRQVRRGLATAVAVPAGLSAALGAIMVGYYVYATMNSVLRPSDYAALRPGTSLGAMDPVLPRMEVIDSGARRAEHPEPPGLSCRYYRADANVLAVGRLYRLCFDGDRLARKDVLLPPRPATTETEPQTGPETGAP